MTHAQFTGRCKWARLSKPDEKYNKYSIAIGLDAKQFMELQKLKVRNAGKLDEHGLFWTNFHRKESLGAPKVVDGSGNPVTDLIGNDSSVTAEVEIKSWTDKNTGATQYAAVLVGVRVDDLIKYNPDGGKREDTGTVGNAAPPQQSASAAPSSPSSLPTPKRMF